MPSGPPPGPRSAELYPWSQRRLTFTSQQPNPFPRYGAAVNAVSSKEGDVYLMGGLINGSTVKGDLWMIEAGGSNMACYPVPTTFEGPGPRVGHASLLVGNAFIVFGGDTKQDERDKLDDTLYLLNTCKYRLRTNIVFSTDICSDPALVTVSSPRPTASRSIWSYTKHFGLENLCLRWSGGGLLF